MKTKLKEYFKNMSNTKKIAISVLAMVFVCLVFTGSYALFNIKIANRTYVVKVGTLDIDFEDANSNLIVLNNTYPMTNNEGLATTGYTFNVSNNGTVPGKYLVRLEISDDNEIPIEYIKVAYQKTKDESINVSSPSLSTPKLLSNLNDSLVVFKDESIGVGKKDTINLKLWLDINTPNDMQGKQFKARIVIDSTQDYEDARYAINTKPIIELNKDENGNIDYIIPVNGTYTELGVASVKDDKDKLTPSDVTITGTVDTTTAGTYTRTYSVTDSDNNTSTVTRTIYVGDPNSLTIYHSIDEVVNSFSTAEKNGKEAIICSHIYGYDDLYLDCETRDTLRNSFTRYENDKYIGKMRGAVILLDDVELDMRILLYNQTEYILELNGHTIYGNNYTGTNNSYVANDGIFDVQGNFTINSRVAGGSMITGKSSGTVYVASNGKLTINGGTFNGREGIVADGTNSNIVINGGTFNANVYGAATLHENCSNCTMEINGGTFSSTKDVIVNDSNNSLLHITNATVNGLSTSVGDFTISNYGGNIKIDNGTFTATKGVTVYNRTGTIDISNGTFTSNDNRVVFNAENGIVNITGGSFTATGSAGGTVAIANNNGTVNITDTNNRVYISSRTTANNWNIYAINHIGAATTNITGAKADTCTDTIGSNTSGICVYAVNGRTIAAFAGNGQLNIDGGTFYNGGTYTRSNIDNMTNTINIKNAEVNGFIYANEGGSGNINICNSTVNTLRVADYSSDPVGNIYYRSDVTYTTITDGNTPAHIILDDTITCTGN